MICLIGVDKRDIWINPDFIVTMENGKDVNPYSNYKKHGLHAN